MSYGQDGFGWGVYAQRYDAGGARVGDETQVNTSTADFEQNPSVAALPRGGFVVSWMAVGQDGSGSGVYQRTFPGLDPASPPVASDAFASGSEDGGPITGAVSATDTNDDALTYALVGAAPAGVVFNPDGTFSVTPLAADQALDVGETRTVTFQYVANDGSANSAPATVTVTITGVNDAPVAADVAASGTEDGGAVTGAVSATDLDGEPLTYTLVDETPAGVVFNADGTFSVTPLAADQALDDGETRVVTFQYRASDGSTGSAPATVTVTITGVNDAPVVSRPIANLAPLEDAAFSFTLAPDVFIDPDGDVLSFTATLANGDALPSWLQFNAATRTFSGTPQEGDRPVTVRVVAHDGSVSVAHEFTITPQDNPGEIWTGGSGHDHHVGTDRQDVLQGGKGHDTLNGGAGADWIWGGVGHDTLTGGAGRDTFVFERRSGHDVITDFLVGTDRLLFTGGVSIERLIEIDTNDDQVADSTMVVFGGGNHVILMDVLGVTQSQLLTPDWMI
jgi:VCBS repeat-containing protein